MKFSRAIALLGATTALLGESTASPFARIFRRGHEKIAPKFVIVSMFTPEAAVWWHIPDFNILAVRACASCTENWRG